MIEIDHGACVGCGLCGEACPIGAISVTFGKARVDPSACTGCGHCLYVCRTGAIHWKVEKSPQKISRPLLARAGRAKPHHLMSKRPSFPKAGNVHGEIKELKKHVKELQKQADEIIWRIDRL
jgi:MinD superfamily P-loop ATPase